MPFCGSHFTFYRYGDCPDCLRNRLLRQPYATAMALTGRLNLLLATPEAIFQDQFGVCGTTSIVYFLLRYQHLRALELFRATFADVVPAFRGARFATARHGAQSIDFTYLSRRFALRRNNTPVTEAGVQRNVRIAAGLHVPAIQPVAAIDTQFFVDFCLSRALGYLFKKVDNTRYQQEKLQFNVEFDTLRPLVAGAAPVRLDYRNATRASVLALRTQSMAFILRHIIGVANLGVLRNQQGQNLVPQAQPVVAPAFFANEAQLRAVLAPVLATARSFIFAAIFAELINNSGAVAGGAVGAIHVPFVAPGRLDFNHWVVVLGYQFIPAVAGAACASAHVRLTLWSWGATYQVDVCDDNLMDYMQDFVHGELP